MYSVVLRGTRYATHSGLDANHNPTFSGGTPPDTHYAYDADGNLQTEALPDGVTNTYSYDGLNRLTEVRSKNTSNNRIIFDQVYELNDDGSRKDVTETRYNLSDGTVFSRVKIDWTYNDNGRLSDEAETVLAGGSNAPAAYTDHFAYDLAGNRVQETVDEGNDASLDATINYTYSNDDQLLTETRGGTGAYTILYGHYSGSAFVDGYDANGSLVEQHKTVGTTTTDSSYTYDLRNRMIGATVGGVATAYTYDSQGARVSETTGGAQGGTTYYLNDPSNATGYAKAVEESAVLDGTSPVRAYVLGLDVVAQSDTASGLLYLLHDGHGSTRALLGGSGSDGNLAIAEIYNYKAFGDLLASVGAQSDVSAARTRWLFAGDGILDPATGWRKTESRYINGFWFTSRDDITVATGDFVNANLYVYVGGNPINLNDPNGKFSLTSILVGAGIAGLISGGLSVSIKAATNVWSGKPIGKDLWDSFFRGGLSTAITVPLIPATGPFAASFTGNLSGGLIVDWFEGRFEEGGQFSGEKFEKVFKEEAILATMSGGLTAVGARLSDAVDAPFMKNMTDYMKSGRIGIALDHGVGTLLTKLGLKSIGQRFLKAAEQAAGSSVLRTSIWAEAKEQTKTYLAFSTLMKLATTFAKGILQVFE